MRGAESIHHMHDGFAIAIGEREEFAELPPQPAFIG